MRVICEEKKTKSIFFTMFLHLFRSAPLCMNNIHWIYYIILLHVFMVFVNNEHAHRHFCRNSKQKRYLWLSFGGCFAHFIHLLLVFLITCFLIASDYTEYTIGVYTAFLCLKKKQTTLFVFHPFWCAYTQLLLLLLNIVFYLCFFSFSLSFLL